VPTAWICSALRPKRRWRAAKCCNAASNGHVEIRPQLLGEIELRIGQIPQQEIADALLTPGADEQIRIR
jgi:hypothetical protein